MKMDFTLLALRSITAFVLSFFILIQVFALQVSATTYNGEITSANPIQVNATSPKYTELEQGDGMYEITVSSVTGNIDLAIFKDGGPIGLASDHRPEGSPLWELKAVKIGEYSWKCNVDKPLLFAILSDDETGGAVVVAIKYVLVPIAYLYYPGDYTGGFILICCLPVFLVLVLLFAVVGFLIFRVIRKKEPGKRPP
jgi:hypothetical protein